jgi:hypothetical protein
LGLIKQNFEEKKQNFEEKKQNFEEKHLKTWKYIIIINGSAYMQRLW